MQNNENEKNTLPFFTLLRQLNPVYKVKTPMTKLRVNINKNSYLTYYGGMPNFTGNVQKFTLKESSIHPLPPDDVPLPATKNNSLCLTYDKETPTRPLIWSLK
jgi:hypothetical protein